MASAQPGLNDGYEQPPQVGCDERRLQMRALGDWTGAATESVPPSLAAMQRVTGASSRDCSFALRVPRDDSEPEFVFIGNALLADCGDVAPIRRLGDVPPRTLLSRLTDHYLECVANAAPVGFEASFVNHRGEPTIYRGILLPLAEPGGAIDHVWGAINGKTEGAEPDVTPQKPETVRKTEEAVCTRPVSDDQTAAPEPEPRQPPARKPRVDCAPAAVSAEPSPIPLDSPRSAATTKDRSAETMSLEQKLAECMGIDGAIAVALVENSSGMAIATAGNPRNLDMNVAAAGSSNVLRAKQQALKDLGLKEEIEDVLITLATQYHLIRPLSDASGKGLAVYLVLDRAKGNLAMARFKLSRIEKDLTI